MKYKIAYWIEEEEPRDSHWKTVGFLYCYEKEYKKYMNRFPSNCIAFYQSNSWLCSVCKGNEKEIHIQGWLVYTEKEKEKLEKELNQLVLLNIGGLLNICKKCFNTGYFREHNNYQYEIGEL